MKLNIKPIYAFIAAIVIVAAIGVKLHSNSPKIAPVNDITLANLEALLESEDDTEKGNTDPEKGNTDPEKGSTIPKIAPLLGCSDFSCVIYCQAKCNDCGTIFRAVGGVGPTVDVKGGCNKCGSKSFSY